LLVAFFLAGCATVQQEFEETRSAWQGATYDEVVARWGAPARSTTLADGRQAHTWVTQQPPTLSPGPTVGVGVGVGSGGRTGVGVGLGFPFGGTAAPSMCERTFTFENNQVVEQSWVGDEAYCRYFGRA
jgi:hypothetical protein